MLAKRPIGPGHPCFVIAEAGVNHNGDLEVAKKLIDASRDAGADAVKFQTWITEKIVTRDAPLAEYQERNTSGGMSQFDMLKALELPQSAFRELKSYADGRGIIFFSTPDEEESATFLNELGVDLFKIGSGEVTNTPFLGFVAKLGKPVILSTGMSDLGEVERAVRTIEAHGNPPLALLHCVSNYPADAGDCNLRAIDTLAKAFNVPAGFSDHTLGIDVAAAAVARGACIIEKHITLDKTMSGPDHAASLDPAEFRAMVESIRRVESALGDGIKRPTASELETKRVVQKRLVLARSIERGETIGNDHIALRRTSGGLTPDALQYVVGRKAARAIDAGTPLDWSLVE